MVDQAPPQYSRRTIISAADMLKELGHTGFDRFLLELDLPDQSVGRGGSLMARANSLAEFAIKNPQLLSPERRSIPYEIIRRATELWNSGGANNVNSAEREGFAAAMRREGLEGNLVPVSSDSITPGNEMNEDHRKEASIVLSETGIAKSQISITSKNTSTSYPRRVFVVHGHDEGARQSVARFLEKLGFEVVILHEQANKGKTVIEKFEEHSDVGFVVVLLTADDNGSKVDTPPLPRARQNVLLEWGYFIGRLGRQRVCALKKGDLEMPSDIIGIVSEPLDEHGAWRMKLAQELEAANFEINWEKLAH